MSRETMIASYAAAWAERYRDGVPVTVPPHDLTSAEVADWFSDKQHGLREFRLAMRNVLSHERAGSAEILSELLLDWCAADGDSAHAIARALSADVARELEMAICDELSEIEARQEAAEADPLWHGVAEFGPDMSQTGVQSE